jgi:hypothetical protein
LLQRISAALSRASTPLALLLALAVYALFLVTVMPQQSAASRAYAGEWGAPDRQLFYTPAEFYAEVAKWGAAGRRDYADFRRGLDVAWALAYTAFLVVAISCAARSAFAFQDRRRLLNLAPLPAMACDYAENALGIWLVSAWPARHEPLAWMAAVVTATKWATLAAAHGVLLYVLLVALARRVGRPRDGAQ